MISMRREIKQYNCPDCARRLTVHGDICPHGRKHRTCPEVGWIKKKPAPGRPGAGFMFGAPSAHQSFCCR